MNNYIDGMLIDYTISNDEITNLINPKQTKLC
jgi:hypothetical protein